jgi:hypothetical protein
MQKSAINNTSVTPKKKGVQSAEIIGITPD